MVRQQRTIKETFEYEGIGLHTGKQVKTVFRPAPPDTGIVFRRIDLDPVVEIPANIDYVHDGEIKRNTTVSRNGALVHTAAHPRHGERTPDRQLLYRYQCGRAPGAA